MYLKYLTFLFCAAIAFGLALDNNLLDAGIQSVDVDEIKNALKEKCMKVADEDAFNKAWQSKDDFQKCIEKLINFQTIKQEIEDAKPTGDLDLVFKKYCDKKPQFKTCVKTYTSVMELCLNEKEKENTNIIMNATERLGDFICYKDGDRIALFIAEGGPECLSSKQDGITNCLNTTVSKYLPNEKPTLSNLPELTLKPEQCADIDKMQKCIVEVLEGCDEPTPANIAESLFRFIKQVTPCGKKQ